MFYYEQYADPTADNATALLEKIYEHYSIEEDSSYAFCSGHTGPFWLLEHLNRHEFLDMDMEYLANDFVTATIEQSRDHLLTSHGRSLPLFYTHEKPVGAFVDAFSLAHGSCAILIVLAKIYQAGIAQAQCRQLMLESSPFLLHHKNTPAEGSHQALFPAILDGHSINSRLSWCYGDLNVALALWRCGQVLWFRRHRRLLPEVLVRDQRYHASLEECAAKRCRRSWGRCRHGLYAAVSQ